MINAKSISVFFPAFNDEGTIESLVTDALAVLPRLTDDFEVLVVNDGSTDATPTVLDELERARPHVRVIHHGSNQGYGAALRTGFAHARKDLIFYTDGDGQYDAREIENLFPLMTDEVEIVNGYKINRADGRHRRMAGWLYNSLARFLFRLPIRDVDCDFRLMRREAVERLDLVSSSGVICVELVRKLHADGCAFVEAPVHHYPRRYGRSQFFTFGRVARTAFDFFTLWLKLVALRFPAKSKSTQPASSVQ
ncbi:MAG TPA: glycosyltransferase family 2 protein [Pyrinomonadaceae bacterium]|nr:glycosyltransferase family 2 protein [Pyrinomonadaceae bacterium]